MSVTMSIPDSVADELYWILDENDERRAADDELNEWFKRLYQKMPGVWNRLETSERQATGQEQRNA